MKNIKLSSIVQQAYQGLQGEILQMIRDLVERILKEAQSSIIGRSFYERKAGEKLYPWELFLESGFSDFFWRDSSFLIAEDTLCWGRVLLVATVAETEQQLCLYHLFHAMKRALRDKQMLNQKRLGWQFWSCFDCEKSDETEQRLRQFFRTWRNREPEAVSVIEGNWRRLFSYFNLPLAYRHRA